ncbi:hypothetical protein Scep_018146 [Stephania cephalantha]|uniref:PUM-HD domain-containing protein n=1 Tax=Stephania cephalantha TaxID=152367 RepID=A0AAP0NUZ2_9MAGN
MHISLLWSYIKRFPGMAMHMTEFPDMTMPAISFPGMAMPATSFPGMAVPGTRECFDIRLAGMEGSLDIARGESPILGLVESSRTRFPGQGSSSSMNLNLNPNSSMFCTNHQSGKDHERSVLGMPRDERAYLPLQMISEKDLHVNNATFDEIKGHIAELMESPYGNNYVKEFFDRCENNQKDQLVREVTGNAFVFAKLCFDTHGVFSVKQMLKSVADPAQITLIFKALKPLVYRLMTNTNAAEHVIETCVGNHPVEFRKFSVHDPLVKFFEEKHPVLYLLLEFPREPLANNLEARR